MDTNPRRETVAGVFEDEAAASAALQKLVEAHFDIEADASIIVSNHHERQVVPILSDVPVDRGAVLGAAIGAVLAAIGVLIAGIDFGPFSLEPWGPAYAALEAAFAAGSIGVATGAMMSFEFAKPAAAFDKVQIRDGVIWVGVQAAGARADRARQILTEAGARHFTRQRPTPVAA
ncbi:MAG: hypothetical protein AB7T31_10800 [Gemmatimonadales bacterium]